MYNIFILINFKFINKIMEIILLLFIIFILSNCQNNNKEKSFNDLFENQKKIYKLTNDIKRFKEYFNMSERNNDNKNFEDKKDLCNIERAYDKIINNFPKEKKNNNEVHLLEINNFSQKNQTLLTFHIILKFIWMKPAKNISFSTKIIYKNYNNSSNNKKENIKSICDFLEFNYLDSTAKYNCTLKTNGIVEFISSYNDFFFDGIKYELESEKEIEPEFCDSQKIFERMNIHFEDNNYFFIKGKLKDLDDNENKLKFEMKQKFNNENFETNIECYFQDYIGNDDYILQCYTEKNFIRNIYEEVYKNKNIQREENEKSNGLTKKGLVIISFAFSVLLIFLLIFAIMLRRQKTEIIISIKVKME